jgi:hypothetical protein
VTGGQIAALIFALLLLLPGGCFLFFGFGLMGESHMGDVAAMMLLFGILILGLMAFLFWVAFRKRPPAAGAGGGGA